MRSALRSSSVGPPLVLALVLAVVVAVLASVNAGLGGYVLDETLIKQSAVHYTRGLPDTLFNDVNARATSRLYSLLMSPLFAAQPGDVGVRAARALNALLFASAAFPAYLLGLQVMRDRWRAAVAAGLCAVVPWMTLTTAMFAESLAYPLVLWVAVAMMWAFNRPRWWRDAAVLVALGLAICTRTQLVALAGGYAIVVVARMWLDRPRHGIPHWSIWASRSARDFAPSVVAAVLGALFLARLAVQGRLAEEARALLGTYAVTTTDQRSLPTDVGLSLSVEVLAIALGLGVIPVVLALAWYPRALAWRGGRFREAHAYALVTTAMVVSLFAATLYSQGIYLREDTEERYYFYAAPFLLIAAHAAVETRSVTRRGLLEATAVLVLIALLLPLPRSLGSLETAFFAPAIGTTRFASSEALEALRSGLGRTGLGERDVLAAVLLAAGLLLSVLWRAAPRRGPAIAVTLAAVVQVAVASFAYASIDGRVDGVPGRPGADFRALGFVDRAAGSRPVTWLDNQPRPDEGLADDVQRTALLYNDQIRQRLALTELSAITPDNFPLNGLPRVTASLAPGSGRLTLPGPPPEDAALVVGSVASPFLQLGGTVVARSQAAARLQLVEATQPLQARWRAIGLDTTGTLAPGSRARLDGWGAWNVRLRLTSADAGVVRVSLGGRRQTIRKAAGEASVALVSCAHARGTLWATVPVTVTAVELTRRPTGACP